jgi:anti-sigma B factor antagonist
LNIRSRERGDVTVLDLEGRITLGSGDVALRGAVRGALQAGRLRIVLNLRGVEYADSAGIGEMVAAANAAERLGGGAKIAEPSGSLRDVLGRFPDVLDVYDSEDAALRAF